MSTTSGNGSAGIVGGIAKWWRNLRDTRARLGELHAAGDEVANIARDIGLSRADLYTIAAKRPDAANQLKRRLAALDIDEAALSRNEPRVARDLERVCSLCGSSSNVPSGRLPLINPTNLNASYGGSQTTTATFAITGAMDPNVRLREQDNITNFSSGRLE